MPRFFLHIRYGDRRIEDPDGSVLPDLAAARAEAVSSAREILAERLRAGEELDDRCFEIADEAGTVLDCVPLREAIKTFPV